MAFLEFHYHSDALKRQVGVNVLLPEAPKTAIGIVGQSAENYKTLYLLHGLSDDFTIWMRRTSIERYAIEYGIAVVMPEVGRNWYVDTAYGRNYFTFITDELPRVCESYFKGMRTDREGRLIAGLSMGGYGAIKAALTYPEKYFACGSLSGALDITSAHRYALLQEWKGIFGEGLTDFTELKGTKHDVYSLAEKAKRFPKLYMWCGTEDKLLECNRRMHAQLLSQGVEHSYNEGEGDHSWKYWDEHIQDLLKYLLND